MFRRFEIVLICSTAFGIMSGCTGLAKPAPIPSGSEVYTQKQFDKVLVRFHHRTIVEVYQKMGVHNPAWDGLSVPFLESYAQSITDTAGAVSETKLLEQGKAAIDAGCSDPIVLSSYGIALYVNGKTAEAEPILERALEGFKQSGYPKCRARLVPVYLLNVRTDLGTVQEEERERLRNLGVSWFIESFSDGSYQAGEERVILDLFPAACGNLFYAGKWEQISDAAGKMKRFDAYLVKVIQGRCRIARAWEARGGGWASTVTEEGWKGFAEHLSVARKLLTEAWKLRPKYPDAPTSMIAIAMAGHAGPGESPRLWFDRAAAAQMDYTPAYSAYIWNLRPRWGGSLEEMYRFGVECLMTKRFDTAVPWQFFKTLQDITEDLEGGREYWRRPETKKYLDMLFDGYEKSGYCANVHWRETQRAGSAWYRGAYAEAKELLDKLGSNVEPSVFPCFFHTNYDMARAEIYAYGGSTGPEVRRAERLRKRNKVSEALATYKGVLSKNQDDKNILPYIQKRIAQLEIEDRFYKGEDVDLKPSEDFVGWRKYAGEWVVEKDGSIQGTSNNHGLILLCDADLGNRVEIKGEIEFISTKYSLFTGGVILGQLWERGGDFTKLLFNKYDDKFSILPYDQKAETAVRPKVDLKDRNTFAVQLWDDTVKVYLNGTLIQEAELELPDSPSEAALRVGIGGNYWFHGSVLKFSNLQVRRLNEKPT